jgi:hypothetical protein
MHFTSRFIFTALLMSGSFSFPAIGYAEQKALCKDCPFPLEIVCEQPKTENGGGDAFPFRCKVQPKKPGFQPIKDLHCVAGGDNPFPHKCAIEY